MKLSSKGPTHVNDAAPTPTKMIWANLLHLSYNMWCDWENPEKFSGYNNYRPHLRFDDTFWNELLEKNAAAGVNMIVLDLGDGVRYRSHPEIAVENAWTTQRLRDELARCRRLGLELIPKLNFATTHDAWLGPYARMVSTPTYYSVCSDLIDEVCELFDRPRFFHLGMDEENAGLQRRYEYAVIRQHGLWWRDLQFLVDVVEAKGSRAWVWSDYVWDHADAFFTNMPKGVLQSNWHYRLDFEVDAPRVKDYLALDRAGYDQVPTVSNWYDAKNIAGGVAFSRRHLAAERLKGFLLAPWRPTLPETRPRHFEALEHFAAAIGTYDEEQAR
jgi:hypothetical protein